MSHGSLSSGRYPNGTAFTIMTPTASGDDGEDDMTKNSRRYYLSVASFNLLAPVYVRPHDKRTGSIQTFAAFEWVSEKDSKDVLDMETRGPRLLESLRSCQADVICLQELQLKRTRQKKNNSHDTKEEEDGFALPTWIRPIVDEEPYYKVHLPPQDELESIAERNKRVLDKDAAVTSALLYRTDRLVPVVVVQSKNNNNDKKDVDGRDTTTCVSLCLRGKSGSSLESMHPITVSSLHLDATSEKKRVSQFAKCLGRARALQPPIIRSESTTTLQPISTILAGDMNQELFSGSCLRAFLGDDDDDADSTTPTDAEMERECASDLRLGKETTPTEEQMQEWRDLYAEAAGTVYDYCVTIDRIQSGPTRSGYDHADSSSSSSSTTTSTEKRSMVQWRLDHILYTPNTLQPVGSWVTLEEDPESCRTGLPNHKYGSDHIPVGALFQVLPTPPQLSQEERVSLLGSLENLLSAQKTALQEQESTLDTELARIELQVLPNNNNTQSCSNNKRKKKKKPPQEIMDFLRHKRTILRELKAQQQEERRAFVKDGQHNDASNYYLQRLLIEETYGCTARQWIERGCY